MMAAARSLLCACAVIALLAGTAVPDVAAQQTIQVATPSNTRVLLREAENLLARNDGPAAYDLLSAHESELAGNAYFDYLLGVAALDTGRTSEAILSLRRSVASAPEFSAARMELARAHFDAGEPHAARPLFAKLLNENPPPGVHNVIEQYIAAIDARPASRSRFSPYAELIVGHDDNANGSTNDQQFLGFTLSPENLATESSFFEAGAGFEFTAPQSANLAWRFAAQASYRNNPDASFVDAGILGAQGGATWRSGAVFGSADIDAYVATRDGDSNETYSGVTLLLGRQLNERWDLRLSLKGGALRYDDAIEILDVDRFLYTIGGSYRFSSRGRFSLEVIGGSDSERQAGSPYGNSKFGGRLSFNAPVGEAAHLFASIGSLESDYDGLFFGVPREDTQLTSVLQLEFRDVMTDGLSIDPRLRYVDNDSDVSLYDYDRTEIGLLIRWVPK